MMKGNRLIGLDTFSARLRRELGILLFISAVGVAIRFPFLFPAVIDWDESTFIIVGQSVVDGFLPNEITWDLKPAFVHWWFGGAIELFGKTIPAVRSAGFMWLLLSAYLLYRAAFFITNNRLGSVFAAAMLIVASSTYALHVSTEHLALLPMAGAILVLCNGGRRLRAVFLGGILLGFACMFRLNLVYLCFVVGAFICAETQRTSWKDFLHGALKKGVWFSVGVLVPVLLSFLPYLFSGHWRLWITVYEAAVSLSEEKRSFANLLQTLHWSYSGDGATMWGAAIVGAFIIFRHWRDLGPERRFDWLLCGAFVVGSFLSIALTGPEVYGHYFVQLVPGLSMFAAAAFISPGKAFGLSKADWTKFVFGTVLIVLAIYRTAAAEWSVLSQRLWRGEPLSYGIAYDIADYIRSQGIEDFSLFMMDQHLVYWLLGRYPPTRLATHPSALGMPFVRKYVEPASHTTEDVLRSVFRREPSFVVGRPDFLRLDPPAVRFLQQELTNAYLLIGQIGHAKVYRRRGWESRMDPAATFSSKPKPW
jgi:4-amino-4-deoxy-L-arabinose transferase-like glycosyltransferase